MLAYVLALAVALGSVALYLTAFIFPALHRKQDFIWSGVGLFYALVLWVCSSRITGAVLLGQTASVALLGWLGWQTLSLRSQVASAISPDAASPIPQVSAVINTVAAWVKDMEGDGIVAQAKRKVAGLFSQDSTQPSAVAAAEPAPTATASKSSLPAFVTQLWEKVLPAIALLKARLGSSTATPEPEAVAEPKEVYVRKKFRTPAAPVVEPPLEEDDDDFETVDTTAEAGPITEGFAKTAEPKVEAAPPVADSSTDETTVPVGAVEDAVVSEPTSATAVSASMPEVGLQGDSAESDNQPESDAETVENAAMQTATVDSPGAESESEGEPDQGETDPTTIKDHSGSIASVVENPEPAATEDSSPAVIELDSEASPDDVVTSSAETLEADTPADADVISSAETLEVDAPADTSESASEPDAMLSERSSTTVGPEEDHLEENQVSQIGGAVSESSPVSEVAASSTEDADETTPTIVMADEKPADSQTTETAAIATPVDNIDPVATLSEQPSTIADSTTTDSEASTSITDQSGPQAESAGESSSVTPSSDQPASEPEPPTDASAAQELETSTPQPEVTSPTSEVQAEVTPLYERLDQQFLDQCQEATLQILQAAQAEAAGNGFPAARPPDLLVAFLLAYSNAANFAKTANISLSETREIIEKLFGQSDLGPIVVGAPALTKPSRKILDAALAASKSHQREALEPEQLLLTLLQSPDSEVQSVLTELDAKVSAMCERLQNELDSSQD